MPPSFFAVTVALIALLALSGYFLLALSSPVKSFINKFYGEENISFAWRMYERLSGTFILGVLPAFVIFIVKKGNEIPAFFFMGAITRFYLIPVCCTSILIINFFATRKASNRKGYPLIRRKNWDGWMMLKNQLSWTVYLFAYEYLFRGVLFSSCIVLVGWPAAMIMNVMLYSVLHFHRGIKQVICSGPFGVVLCLVTIATTSWISAALLHAAFANSYEFFVIAHRKKWWRSSRSETSSFSPSLLSENDKFFNTSYENIR
ncbi:MAG: CPBP family intramembrane glutamic endopeptidase [Chitinophagales bacterium]